ncbi:MAG: IgGFc-binding protein, partial [Paludibacteraceae bacterium]|nr:IgGFc-binding protein [Paludibacteraceae bacterium]
MKKKIATILLAFIASVGMTFAQSGTCTESTYRANTTEGTSFLIVFPRITGTRVTDPTLQMYVMATANEAVTITVRSKNSKMGEIQIPAGGGFGSLKIDNNLLGYMFDDDLVYPRGIIAFSNDGKTPFSCYAFIQSGPLGNSARDFALAIPQKALGREYMIQTFPTDGKSTEFVILAAEDNTTVRIIPNEVTSTGQAAGTPFVRNLNRLESVMIASKQKVKDSSDTLDMSGSLICSNKPVAVFAANEATNIPFAEAYSWDYTFEQVPPLNTFGKRFFVARLDSCIKNMECCVTALYNNTEVKEYRYNVQTGQTTTVTTTLNAYQSLARRPCLTEKIFNIVIETSQPVLCHTYLTSASYNCESIYDENGKLIITNTWGDPANAMLVPWNHRVKDMTFLTNKLPKKDDESDSYWNNQHHYVHVNVPKNEIGLLQLDGETVSNSLFKTYGGDANMAYAIVPVEKFGKHRLTT